MGEGACVHLLEDYERAAGAWSPDLRGGARLRHLERRAPHGAARPGRRSGSAEMMRGGDRARRHRAGARRLHQCARHLDASGRPGGDEGDQGGLRPARVRARRLLDEVRARAPVRSRRRGRGDDVRAARSTRACCRRRSTTGTRTRSATSTTSRTRRASVQVDVALSNAMGLGGHNACVLLGRVE